MFGYKLEIWRYETANYDKAQEHILEMAEKGYELVDISTYWVPLAGYRKTENARRRKYCVVVVPTDDENFMQLCEDCGWHLLAGQKVGLTVLYSEDPDARPIFTEEESEAIMAQEVVSDKQFDIGCAYIFAVPIMLIATWVAFRLGSIDILKTFPIIIFCVLAWFVLIMELVSMILENRALKEQIRLAREGEIYEKPEWLYKFYSFKIVVSILGCLGLIGFYLWAWTLHLEAHLTVLIMAAVVVVFLAGVFVRVFLKKEKLGTILMMLAVIVMFMMREILRDW